jgi:hypothetical protein
MKYESPIIIEAAQADGPDTQGFLDICAKTACVSF